MVRAKDELAVHVNMRRFGRLAAASVRQIGSAHEFNRHGEHVTNAPRKRA